MVDAFSFNKILDINTLLNMISYEFQGNNIEYKMPRVALLLFALLIGTLMISQGEGCNKPNKPLDLTRLVNEYCDRKCHNSQVQEVNLPECERCAGVLHYLKRQLHED